MEEQRYYIQIGLEDIKNKFAFKKGVAFRNIIYAKNNLITTYLII